MDDNVKQHLATTRQLTAAALRADGVQAVALCQEAQQELARAENLLVRAVMKHACEEMRP